MNLINYDTPPAVVVADKISIFLSISGLWVKRNNKNELINYLYSNTAAVAVAEYKKPTQHEIILFKLKRRSKSSSSSRYSTLYWTTKRHASIHCQKKEAILYENYLCKYHTPPTAVAVVADFRSRKTPSRMRVIKLIKYIFSNHPAAVAVVVVTISEVHSKYFKFNCFCHFRPQKQKQQ